jgi:RimJ/RimL family protein N-acetyltransferase
MIYLRQPHLQNINDQLNWYNNTNDIFYACLENDQVFGFFGLTYIDWINRKCELSFINEHYVDYRSEFQIETAKKVCFRELNMNKLWAEIYDIDKKKQDVLTKCGFAKEALLKKTYFYDGKYKDSYIYSIFGG